MAAEFGGWVVRSYVERVAVSGGKLGKWWGSQVLETACNPGPVLETNLLYSLFYLLCSGAAVGKKREIFPAFSLVARAEP